MQAIYQILNIKNNKIYIGSTNNLNKRWNNHRSKLNNGIHENGYLQAAWIKYGQDNFQFSILEEVSDQNRIEREIYYLNEKKSYERNIGYNFDKNPTDKSGSNNPFYGKNHDDATKQRMAMLASNRDDDLKRRMGEKNKGEGSAFAKLTWELARDIRELYKKGGYTHRSLATKYNISRSAIQALMENRTWVE
jgi:group I intron endonuclease